MKKSHQYHYGTTSTTSGGGNGGNAGGGGGGGGPGGGSYHHSHMYAPASSQSSQYEQHSRSSYANNNGGIHQQAASSASSQQERKCDNCLYRVAINECQQFKCKDCGTYIICDYCYEDYLEQSEEYYDYGQQTSSPPQHHHTSSSLDPQHKKKAPLSTMLQQMGSYQKLKCVYCSAKHSLNDITVKTLKSFGFIPQKGTNKIPISTLSKEKIKKLANLRVIQKTLVYVIGLAPEIASEEILKSPEFFGQYGDLTKVVVNTHSPYNATKAGPSYSAYLTYSHPRESAIAILSVDQFMYMERMLRASFGTSKFCQFFMNGQKCTNKDCLYLHEIRTDLEAYTKEDMQNNKFIFQEQQKIAIKLSRALEMSLDDFSIYNRSINKNLDSILSLKAELPSPDTIYYKDFHFLEEPLIHRKNIAPIAHIEPSPPSEHISPMIPPPKCTSVGPSSNSAVESLFMDLGGKESNNTLVPPNLQKENSMPVQNKQQIIYIQQQQQSPAKKMQQPIETEEDRDPEENEEEEVHQEQEDIQRDLEEEEQERRQIEVLELIADDEQEEDENGIQLLETSSRLPDETSSSDLIQQSSVEPLQFRRNIDSRFQFAQSATSATEVIPNTTTTATTNDNNFDDWDEIEVPKKIQDLIDLNIRTLSSNGVNLLLHKSHSVEEAPTTTAMILQEQLQHLELSDVRERWLTKKERMMAEEEEEEHIENEEQNQDQQEKQEQEEININSQYAQNMGVIINSNATGRTVTLRQSNPDEMRAKLMRPAENDVYPYNLSDHSANIRVKYSRMNAGGREEQEQTTASPHHNNYQSYSSVFGGAYQYVPVSQKQQQPIYKPVGSSNYYQAVGLSQNKQQSSSGSASAASFNNSSFNKQRRRKEDKRADNHPRASFGGSMNNGSSQYQ